MSSICRDSNVGWLVTNTCLSHVFSWACNNIQYDNSSADYNFATSGLGNEDCLFVSVFAPPDADGLPVMVWIREYLGPYFFIKLDSVDDLS